MKIQESYSGKITIDKFQDKVDKDMVELNEPKRADEQDAPAQFNLGLCYDKGDGVPQSDAEAAKWWKKAADQGYAPAQHNLGVYYDEGRGGVGRSSTEAAKLWEKAANQCFDDAQFNLGLCYLNGDGVEQNPKEAAKWFQEAAEQGHAPARFNLGLCYGKGDGVPGGRNHKEAIELVTKADVQGFPQAKPTLQMFGERGSATLETIERERLARYTRLCNESSVPSLTWKEYGKFANRFRASFLRGYKNTAELAKELDKLAEKNKAVAYEQLIKVKEQTDKKTELDIGEYRNLSDQFLEFGLGYKNAAKLAKECEKRYQQLMDERIRKEKREENIRKNTRNIALLIQIGIIIPWLMAVSSYADFGLMSFIIFAGVPLVSFSLIFSRGRDSSLSYLGLIATILVSLFVLLGMDSGNLPFIMVALHYAYGLGNITASIMVFVFPKTLKKKGANESYVHGSLGTAF